MENQMSNKLQIYNTLSKRKETFESIDQGIVKMYICGPTVYDLVHIGNLRGPIFCNLVRNWFEELGYKVTYVQNFTDVDDKIINKANAEKASPTDVSEKYIKEYQSDYGRLELHVHDHAPKVTEHMPDIIKFIERIIESNKAYVAPDGEVIFSVRSFDGYGKLSHKNLDELQSGVRVEISDKKKDPLDFTLWKPAKPGEPSWDSPWGKGRPGWHIECSAMSTAILGETFDLHCGGIDLIFPHHENEIAQSEGATSKPYVKYWMHWNFINFGAHKMSKSLGNVKTGRSFMDQYHPEILKFMVLRAHYRSLVDFSEEQIHDAIHGLARIYSSLCLATCALGSEASSYIHEIKNQKSLFFKQEFKEAVFQTAQMEIKKALCDDFNTPEVFAQIFNVVRFFNGKYKRGQKVSDEIKLHAKNTILTIHQIGNLMSLFQSSPDVFLSELDSLLLEKRNLNRDEIQNIVNERSQARSNKDFSKSDELRDKLVKLGISIQDTPEGTYWEVSK